MLVQDLVRRSTVSIGHRDRMSDACRLMESNDVGSVVVLGDDGEPVGVLTDRDVALYMSQGFDDPSVREVMTWEPITIEADQDIEACLKRMEESRVRRILVVEPGGDKRLVGVVSLDDILVHLGEVMSRAAALIQAEIAYR